MVFNNAMKANPDKCHFLSSFDTNTKISVNSVGIENTISQKLLGVIIDRKLNFHDYVSNLCKKVSAKISSMAAVLPFMQLIMKAILIYSFPMHPFSTP